MTHSQNTDVTIWVTKTNQALLIRLALLGLQPYLVWKQAIFFHWCIYFLQIIFKFLKALKFPSDIHWNPEVDLTSWPCQSQQFPSGFIIRKQSFSEKHFCGWEGPQKFSLKLFNIRHCQIGLKIKLPKLTLEKGVLVAGFKKLADHWYYYLTAIFWCEKAWMCPSPLNEVSKQCPQSTQLILRTTPSIFQADHSCLPPTSLATQTGDLHTRRQWSCFKIFNTC